MTPIKVGDYTVEETYDGGFYAVLDSHGDRISKVVHVADGENPMWVATAFCFATIPMALRVAAEAAGIERQRVEATLMTTEHMGFDGRPGEAYDVLQFVTTDSAGYLAFHDALPSALTHATDVARARYADDERISTGQAATVGGAA